MRKTEPYPGTQSVLRAIKLLKTFDDAQPEWGLTDLAREVGLNKTTVYRLMTALESEGMVSRSASQDAYTLGPLAVTLGGRAMRQNDLRVLAKSALVELAEATGETSSLDLLIGDEILIIDEVLGNHLVGSASSLGQRHPALTASTGKAMVAFLPPEQQEALLRIPPPQWTMKTITDPAVLRAQLAEVREKGYAISAEELEEGLIVVGAPVFNHDCEPAAAICVGGPTLRIPPERIPALGELVRETAARLSLRLGCPQLP